MRVQDYETRGIFFIGVILVSFAIGSLYGTEMGWLTAGGTFIFVAVVFETLKYFESRNDR